jgi:hypothetical protein
MDDGTAEVLVLRSVGTTADGRMILEAGPAKGLSSFIFVSIMEAPVASGTVAIPPVASPASSTAPTQSGTALSAICAAVAGLIGVTGIYCNKKR